MKRYLRSPADRRPPGRRPCHLLPVLRGGAFPPRRPVSRLRLAATPLRPRLWLSGLPPLRLWNGRVRDGIPDYGLGLRHWLWISVYNGYGLGGYSGSGIRLRLCLLRLRVRWLRHGRLSGRLRYIDLDRDGSLRRVLHELVPVLIAWDRGRSRSGWVEPTGIARLAPVGCTHPTRTNDQRIEGLGRGLLGGSDPGPIRSPSTFFHAPPKRKPIPPGDRTVIEPATSNR